MSLLNLLFPRRCVSCGKMGRYFCSNCFKKIKYIDRSFCPVCRRYSFDGSVHAACLSPWSLNGLTVMAHYKGPVKQAIKMIKYRYVSHLAEELSGLFLEKYPSFLNKLDILVPVPLHHQRERERGFNQSLIIARCLGKNLNISVRDDLLKRKRHTRPQFGLKINDRKTNIRDAFRSYHSEVISGKKIGLVDDVATTFSTLRECAQELKKSGARSVWAFVIAHGN